MFTVHLQDDLVSRQHAVLRPAESGWIIEDCGSKNGLWVGSTRVPQAEVCAGGITVRFGGPEGIALTIHFGDKTALPSRSLLSPMPRSRGNLGPRWAQWANHRYL